MTTPSPEHSRRTSPPRSSSPRSSSPRSSGTSGEYVRSQASAGSQAANESGEYAGFYASLDGGTPETVQRRDTWRPIARKEDRVELGWSTLAVLGLVAVAAIVWTVLALTKAITTDTATAQVLAVRRETADVIDRSGEPVLTAATTTVSFVDADGRPREARLDGGDGLAAGDEATVRYRTDGTGEVTWERGSAVTPVVVFIALLASVGAIVWAFRS